MRKCIRCKREKAESEFEGHTSCKWCRSYYARRRKTLYAQPRVHEALDRWIRGTAWQ